MTKYREIIRLAGLNLSQTNIALSCNISASVIPCRIAFFLSTFVATYTSHAKKSVALNHTLLRITFVKEFSAGCQPRYPVKIPITT